LPNLDSLASDCSFDVDLLSLGQAGHRSRRILWQDHHRTPGLDGGRSNHGDSSAHKPTSLLSQGKHINVPDEWYSLPVDEKYTHDYITMAILRDEQDFVMGELKRISDNAQVSLVFA
jgi:hypothetical protein